jgi:hypothetical protein
MKKNLKKYNIHKEFNRESFKIFLIIVFVIVGSGIIQSCSKNKNEKTNIVAQVNEAALSYAELEASIPEETSDEVKTVLKRNLIDKWIEDEIFCQVAEEEGLALSEEEKLRVKNYERSLLIQKFLNNHLKDHYRLLDQEIEDYYDKHKNEFIWDDDYVHLIHLVMENDDAAIKSEIRSSKDLMDVIKKNYLDQQSTPERPIGDLKYQKLNEFPSEIVRRVKNMKTGNISGPIKTKFGYHYIQLIDNQKKGRIKDLDVVRNEISMRLQIIKRHEETEVLKKTLRSRFTIQTDLSKVSEP